MLKLVDSDSIESKLSGFDSIYFILIMGETKQGRLELDCIVDGDIQKPTELKLWKFISLRINELIDEIEKGVENA